MIFTAMQAVKAKGKLDDVVLVGFDAIPAVLKAIKAGDVDATVRQDPERMGKEGMELLVRHLQGEKIPTHVQISAEIIDKTNVIPFLTK
jgi:ribose transport system substrate-binding protein